MAVPASGELKLRADINQEINGNDTDTNVSLGTLSDDAGFDAPDTMSEFYSYSSNVTINFSGGSLGNCSIQNNNLTNGQYTPSGAVSNQYWELQVNSGYGFQDYNNTSVSGLPAGMTYSISTASGTSYGLGQGRIRITLGGNYPANSTNINLSVSGGGVTAIREVTATLTSRYSGQQGTYYGYSLNVSSFGAVVAGGTYVTPANNTTTTYKVWNGATNFSAWSMEAQIGEYWGSPTGSTSVATGGWSGSVARNGSSQHLSTLTLTYSAGITSNLSVTVNYISSGGGSNSYTQRNIAQISRTGASSGGNWACSNKSGNNISGLGYTSSSSGTHDPRMKVWGFAKSTGSSQTNWAYGPKSVNEWWFSMWVTQNEGCDFGTGGTQGANMTSAGINGCPA